MPTEPRNKVARPKKEAAKGVGLKWSEELGRALASLALAFLFCAGVQAQTTNIAIGTTTLQSGVKPMGINLGDHNYYDIQQLKNLAMTNPGFAPTIYTTIIGCVSGTTTSCVDQIVNSGQPGGFWPYNSNVQVLTGPAAGCNTGVAGWTSATGSIGGTLSFTSACSAALDNTTWLWVRTTIGPGNSNNNATTLANWWPSTTGSGSITVQSSDLPAGSVALQTADLAVTGSSDTATLTNYFDAPSGGRIYLNLNGTYQIQFLAKVKSGSGTTAVSLQRGSVGSPYYSANSTFTSTWTQYNLSFSASETGSQGGNVNLSFTPNNSAANEVLIANVQVVKTSGLDSTNTSPFRDEVVAQLRNMKLGTLRYWGHQETDTLDNMLASQFLRGPSNFSTYPTNSGAAIYAYNLVSISIPDFLQLAQAANIPEVWIVIPTTFSTTEASELMDYLGGSCSGTPPTYTQKRCTSGAYGGTAQTTPWTSVFSKIHLEAGNEQWNGTFYGGSYAQYGPYGNGTGPASYGAVSQAIFAAIKSNSNYNSSVISLVLGAQFAGLPNMVTSQNSTNNNDEITVGPYFMDWPIDSTYSTSLFQSTLAEPWVFWQPNVSAAPVCNGDAGGGTYVNTPSYMFYPCPSQSFTSTNYVGGGMYIAQEVEANLPTRHAQLAVYEESISPTSAPPSIGGGVAASPLTDTPNNHMLNFAPSLGAGLAVARLGLLNLQNGVVTQNVFQLQQYEFAVAATSQTPHIWGACVALGGGSMNICRPEASAIAMVNAAIPYGATMVQTTITSPPAPISVGSPNTSYASATTVNGVAANNVPLVDAYAFQNGTSHSLILLNSDTSASHAVTWSGTGSPTGSVAETVLTSTNITDNNESSIVVSPTTATLTNPTGLTLAPYSLVTLTWGGSAAPAVTLSPTSLTFGSTLVGTNSPTQTITLTNSGTASLTISAISISGDYSQTNTCGSLPATIAASGTCVFTITFTPTATGTRTGTLTITDNASGSPHTAGLTGTGISYTYTCLNTSADPGNIQTYVNGGGTVLLTGTCNYTASSAILNINNAVTLTGNATFQGNQSQLINLAANNVTISGLTFQYGWIYATSSITSLTLTGNTFKDLYYGTSSNLGKAAFNAFALVSSTISNNTFTDLWGGGVPYSTTYSPGPPGNGANSTYAYIAEGWGNLGLYITSINQTTISNNTFSEIGNDAMHITWEASTGYTGSYSTSGNVIAYNTFTAIRRIPMEIQAQPSTCPGGCNYSLTPTDGLQIKGNYIHAYSPFGFYETWGASLVPGNSTNTIVANNTYIANPNAGSTTVTAPLLPNGASSGGYGGYASCMEASSVNGYWQGNVCASATSGQAFGTPFAYGASSSSVVSPTFQNNVLTGLNANSTDSNVNTPGFDCETAPNCALTARYNYVNATSSPAYTDTPSITPTFISTTGSGASTSFNFGVVSNLSIKNVTWTVDGVTAGTQELADTNSTNFTTTAQWQYHIIINPASYSSTSHSLVMTATDVSGTTATASTSFTGGGATLTNINPGTYTVADATTSCSGSGVNCNWDGGFALYGTNRLSLYQQAVTNTNQQWTVTAGTVSGTFTVCNVGIFGKTGITNACLVDSGSGSATFNGTASGNNNLWVIQTANGTTYSVKNYATGNYVQDAATPANGAATTMGASAYQWTFAVVSPSVPMTYYVSNSGSDSNNGTSSSTPWQTIAKVNGTTLAPGSNVYFNRGSTWREKLVASASGTSSNLITYGAYGTGALPVITGGSLVSWTNVSGNVWKTTTSTTGQSCYANSTCLQLPNFSGTAGIPVASQSAVVANYEYYFDGISVLYVYSVGNPATAIEVPSRNYALDLGGNNYIAVNGLQLQAALYYGLNCQSASTGCSNITISSSAATLNISNGINLLTTINGSRMTNDTISSNTVTHNGSSGIKVGGYWQAFTDSGNTASYNCIVPSSSAYYDNQFCGGLYFFGAGSTADGTYSGTFNATEGSGSTFTGDTATYNGISGGMNTNIGHGIWLDTVTNVSVTQETAYGNLNNNLYAEKTIAGFFRHNLGYGAYASNAATGCFTLAAGLTYNSKNNVVLENTCDGGYSALLTNFESSTGVMIGNTFQNNIFYQHTLSGIAYLSYLSINTLTGSGGGTGNTFVTNGFGGPRSNFIYYNSAFYSTYSSWESAFGASTNSMQLDPALVAPATGNYALTSGSPARGAGTTYSGYPPACSNMTHPDLGYLPYSPCSVILCCLHP